MALRPGHIGTLTSLASALFTVGAWKYRNLTGYIEESAQLYLQTLDLLREDGLRDEQSRKVRFVAMPKILKCRATDLCGLGARLVQHLPVHRRLGEHETVRRFACYLF